AAAELVGAGRDLCRAPAAAAPVRRSVKCVVVPCELGRRPVVVKALVASSPAWAFFFRRERAVLESFAARPPPIAPVQFPSLIAAGERVLVLDRLPGRPIAVRRHAPR